MPRALQIELKRIQKTGGVWPRQINDCIIAAIVGAVYQVAAAVNGPIIQPLADLFDCVEWLFCTRLRLAGKLGYVGPYFVEAVLAKKVASVQHVLAVRGTLHDSGGSAQVDGLVMHGHFPPPAVRGHEQLPP